MNSGGTENNDRARAREELEAIVEELRSLPPSAAANDGGGVATQDTLLKNAVRRFMKDRLALASLAVLVVYVVLAIVVPIVDSSDIIHPQRSTVGMQGPSAEYPFGTNDQGKDMWKLTWQGARVSLMIGFTVALVILVVGVLYGAISGYVGGRTDQYMMRFLDSLYGLPTIPFSIIFITAVRQHFGEKASPLWYMVPALAILSWFTAARIMRSQVLSLRESEYVEAARTMGAGSSRVIGRHLIPNTIGVMIVAIFLEVPGAIMGEATVSFLGLGVQSPNTSWGQLAHEGARYFETAAWLTWIPGLMIATTVLAAILLADGLRDALDPRTEGAK